MVTNEGIPDKGRRDSLLYQPLHESSFIRVEVYKTVYCRRYGGSTPVTTHSFQIPHLKEYLYLF